MAFDLFFEVKAARHEVERVRRKAVPAFGPRTVATPRHHRLGRHGASATSTTHGSTRGVTPTPPLA